MSYKSFQFDCLIQFVKQPGELVRYTNGTYFSPGQFFTGESNQPTSVMDRWQKPGDIATIQRFTTTNGLYAGIVTSSDAGYEDASYVRLKNLSVSWQLPTRYTKKLNLQECRLYVHGQNLITISNYKGLDPENPTFSISSLPPLRIVMVGIHVKI